MGDLKVGVVGLGLGRHYVAAYAASEHVGRLVVCDPDADRVAKMKQAHPEVAEGYEKLEIMLAAEGLDAVSVVTPDHLHRPHTEQCFRAGCHVLQTKPLATNLEDARAIVSASEAANRILMVAHERRFRSRYRAIKEILEMGDLGEIVHLRVDAIQDKRGQFARSPWYASAEAGRTALVGSGIHEVDLVRFLMDRPIVSVSAYSNRIGTLKFPKDKTTAALFQFEGDAVGQVTVTYEAHWPKGKRLDDHFRLVGTRGLVVGDQVGRDGLSGWETLSTDASEIVTGCAGCVHAFLDSVVHGTEVAVSGQDAFDSLAACVAADESAAKGEPVVPEALSGSFGQQQNDYFLGGASSL
ncbi:MAG: Gfo/Idh/MocA family oxidoreductase [bacterium]|nr:Gfo/Idh/MocA family oxidoreductase [bacterium]